MGVLSKPAGRPRKPSGSLPSGQKSRTDKSHGSGGGGRTRIGGFKINQSVPSGETVQHGTGSLPSDKVSAFGSPKRSR